ncbi:MAG: hypothetical protein HZB22_02570 [Deltaproteobacteria bacterium]|nr:hypothetical protein [Deltaproteobacteria bacterium]
MTTIDEFNKWLQRHEDLSLGQGMDDIFEGTIKEGKGLPDLSGSDDLSVRLRIPAQVKDKNFW